jgi:CO/xanthine dehydrogenase Mo-binding subunit
MNKLAEKLGIDPVEFRRRNALRDGLTMAVGTPAPGPVSVPQVIDAAAARFGWDSRRRGTQAKAAEVLAHGRGFAAGFKNVGFSFGYQENSWAKIEIHGHTNIERVILHHAGAEVGQGTHTVMAQMAAEVLGIDASSIEIRASDSASQQNAGSASASRMTFMAGNAIKGAAEAALKKWQAEERPATAEYTYLAPQTTHFDEETGYSTPNFSYAYSAEAVDVDVDTETGHVKLIRVVVADDVGKAINPDLVIGQIEGAVVQAQGYALMEDMKMSGGRVLTDQLSNYLLPTIVDIPRQVDSVMVEVADPNGPWGARGLGEIPFLPLAPAIAAAIHDATGVWFDTLPFLPQRVVAGLREQGIGLL